MSLREQGVIGVPGEPTKVVDPSVIIDNALSNPLNPAHIEALDSLLRPRFIGYFRLRMPNQADDLAQQTLISINRRLSRFDPNKGRAEEPMRNFLAWSYRFARHTYYQAVRRKIREEQPLDLERVETISPKERREQARNFEEFFPQLRERVAPLLSDLQIQTFDLAIAGKSSPQIATEVGISKRAASDRLATTREKVEETVLYPGGFKRLSSYKDDQIRHAAYDGTVRAVRLLGVWYTTDEWVKQYDSRRLKPSGVIFDVDKTEEEKGSKTFSDWFFADVRQASGDKFAWRVRRSMADSHIGVFTPLQIGAGIQRFLLDQNVSLNSTEVKVLEEKLQGTNIKEIANKLDYSVQRIAQIVIQVRALIEDTLLTPNGIRQLVTFKHSPLTIAAIEDRIKATYLMGRWYTTEGEVNAYLDRTKKK